LQGMPRAERDSLPGIDAARAEILVPGAIVLEQVLRLADASAITLSDYGVREGLVTDYLRRHAREVSTISSASDLRMRSVLGLLARFDPDGRHARHVAHLALQLFDALAPRHRLGAPEREWLHFAALLHDLGSAVAYDGHSQHSAYVIRNGGLRGLTGEEVEVVATVARYHGAARPRRRRGEAYAATGRGRRELAALPAKRRQRGPTGSLETRDVKLPLLSPRGHECDQLRAVVQPTEARLPAPQRRHPLRGTGSGPRPARGPDCFLRVAPALEREPGEVQRLDAAVCERC